MMLDHLLLLAIGVPLAVAALIFSGMPKRHSVKLAYLGFGLPALIALYAWVSFPGK